MNVIFIFLVIFFFSLGIRFLYFHLNPFLRYTKARKWDIVPGKITQVFSNGLWFELNEKMNTSDSIMIKYEFKYNGKAYASSNITLEKGDTNIIYSGLNTKGFSGGHLPSFIEKIKRNKNVNVWVNPLNNADSTLVINQAFHLKKVLFGITLIIWSLGLTALSLDFSRSGFVEERIIVLEKKSIEEIDSINK
jgi:hypothetical protein